MKDYRLQIKVKNNYLLSMMEKHGFYSVQSLCKKHEIPPHTVYDYLNLKRPPMGKRGNWSICIIKLSEIFNCTPWDLFPSQHILDVLDKNTAEIEASLEDLGQITVAEGIHTLLPDEAIANKEDAITVDKALDTLTPRTKDIIRRRFGFDGGRETLTQIGDSYNVTQETIRQIEARGLRQLHRISVIKELRLNSNIGEDIRNNVRYKKIQEEKDFRKWNSNSVRVRAILFKSDKKSASFFCGRHDFSTYADSPVVYTRVKSDKQAYFLDAPRWWILRKGLEREILHLPEVSTVTLCGLTLDIESILPISLDELNLDIQSILPEISSYSLDDLHLNKGDESANIKEP